MLTKNSSLLGRSLEKITIFVDFRKEKNSSCIISINVWQIKYSGINGIYMEIYKALKRGTNHSIDYFYIFIFFKIIDDL